MSWILSLSLFHVDLNDPDSTACLFDNSEETSSRLRFKLNGQGLLSDFKDQLEKYLSVLTRYDTTPGDRHQPIVRLTCAWPEGSHITQATYFIRAEMLQRWIARDSENRTVKTFTGLLVGDLPPEITPESVAKFGLKLAHLRP